MTTGTVNGTVALTSEAIKASAAANGEPAFITERRLKALEHYLATPMPGRRDEIWRRVEFGDLNVDAATVRAPFARLATLSALSSEGKNRGAFWGAPEDALKERSALMEENWCAKVFPAGVEQRLGIGGKFHSLNAALWEGGYVLHVPKGVHVELPLQATFHTRPDRDGIFPHNLIVLEEGASATVIEAYVSSEGDKGLCCPQTEIIMAKDSTLRYILLQTIGPEAVYIGAHASHQYASSKLTNVSAHLGSRLSKAFITTRTLEPKAHAYLSGLYYGTQSQKIHIDTMQHHIAGDCTTDLMFKGALDNTARAVYRGMIHLDAGAQKTDSYQQNRTLLLSDDARVDAIPGLEILANDVRCTHGATAGQIDPTILFYLMSRGLSKFEAKKTIMDGFFEEVMIRFGLQNVIDQVRGYVDKKISNEALPLSQE